MHLALHYEHEGGSRYAGLQTKARHLKCTADELVASSFPSLPRPTKRVPYIYEYPATMWRDLHLRRGQGMNGPLRVSYEQIDTYQRIMRIELSPWEVETIIAMDDAWFEQLRQEMKGPKTN